MWPECCACFSCRFSIVRPRATGFFGQITEQLLSAEGLRPSVRVSGQDNGCCLCLVEDGGERTFLSAHGAEYRFDPQWLKDLDPASLDYVYVCGIELEEPTKGDAGLASLASRSAGFFAPGARLSHLDDACWQAIAACRPILHLNEAEAFWLSGMHEIRAAAQTLRQRFNNAVIITCAQRGAVSLRRCRGFFM